MPLPLTARIVEVGPRDGLQNESRPVSIDEKITLIEKLAMAGLKTIESGSFVNPKWVPQMAGSAEVFSGLKRKPGVTYSALTPNLQGFERALAAGVDEVAIFAAASEGFSQKNINCSIAESLQRFTDVLVAAQRAQLPVRGYISCVVGCPYDGDVDPVVVADVTQALLDMGCYEVSLGDTIGVGDARSINRMLEAVLTVTPADKLAIHCHDTYHRALENIEAALQLGVAVIDSSIAGLGGCPYAKGATGNVATEQVVALLDRLGIQHTINVAALNDAATYINQVLARENRG